MGCLYQLTSPSGKSYIGISTKTCDQRWNKHVEHAMGKRDAGALYNALRKYGPANFSRRTLAIADDWNYLCYLERRAIEVFGSKYPNGYNLAPGGEGVTGPRDDRTKALISEAQKRRFANPSERARLAAFGKKGNDAMRSPIGYKAPWEVKKASLRLKNQVTPEEWKKANSAAIKTAMSRPGISAKVKAKAAERAANPQWRERIGLSKRGKKLGPQSDAAKKAHSEAAKLMWKKRKQLTNG